MIALPGYIDQLGPIAMALQGTSPLTMDRLRDTSFWSYFLRHDQDDTFAMPLQLNHQRRPGSALADVHVHVSPAVIPVADQNVYFRTVWTWVKVNGVIPLAGSWTTSYSTLTISTTHSVGQHLIHSLLTNVAAPVPDGYSSHMLLVVTRLSSNPADTYKTNRTEAVPPNTAAANLALLSCDTHFPVTRYGSHEPSHD